MNFSHILNTLRGGRYDSSAAYGRHLRLKRWKHWRDRDLAFALAIGADSVSDFIRQGDGQVAVLQHYGLRTGMSVYDLGCGCGRTAQALQRSGWTGRYIGADIVHGLVSELKSKCPGYEAHVHREPSIVADRESLDLVFHWSVFTHISPEECYLYLEDTFRALKPGGKLVFSFLEFEDPLHWSVFQSRLGRLRRKRRLALLDTFLHRNWIQLWAEKIGFSGLEFANGQDSSHHPPLWQTIAAMEKPS
jgi:SAM-dependent methyltransferase